RRLRARPRDRARRRRAPRRFDRRRHFAGRRRALLPRDPARSGARARLAARWVTATLRRMRSFAAALALLVPACTTPDYGRPLPEGAPALIPLGPGDTRPRFEEAWNSRNELMPAIDRSLEWFTRPSAKDAFPKENITYKRARASVAHFKDLLSNE